MMGIGPSECEWCAKRIPSQPKPVRDKYDGQSLCDECKEEFKKEHSLEEDVVG